MCKNCEIKNAIIDDNDPIHKYWFDFCDSVRNTFEDVSTEEQLFFCENLSEKRSIAEIFMSYIDDAHKQYYNCHACHRFLNKYGGLCRIDKESGRLVSVIFENVFDTDIDRIDNPFLRFATKMANEINKPGSAYRVTRALSKQNINAVPKKVFGDMSFDSVRGFTHLYIDLTLNYRNQIDTSKEAYERYKTFVRNAAKISDDTLDKVEKLMKERVIARSDKYAPVIDFIKRYKFYTAACIDDRNRKINVGWMFALSGASGFWNFNNTTIGELLLNIEEGNMTTQDAINRYNDMINPMKYQRPTKEVSIGALDRATTIFKNKGISFKSLERRFATFEEVKDRSVWTPAIREKIEEENPFEAMKKNRNTSKRSVEKLDEVVSIGLSDFIEKIKTNKVYSISLVNSIYRNDPGVYAFTAPVHEDNDPILYYDTVDNRNPYGWFTMAGHSFFNSLDDCFIGVNDRYNIKVIGIIPFPNIWNPNITNKNGFSGYLFVCDGIKINTTVSNALFPELLRSDLHEIRAVIENYNLQHNLKTVDGQLAAGFGATFGYNNSEVMLEVEFEDFIIRYHMWC